MECHFSECWIKKEKWGRETACHLFALIQDRTRGREQRVCVCVYRHTASTRALLPPPFVRSAALLICTAAGSTSEPLSEWKLSKLLSPSHNPAALCFSHHPLTILRGARWHFSPLAEPLWLGYICAEPGRVGQLLLSGPRQDLNPFFFLSEKCGTLKQLVKCRPHPSSFFPSRLICFFLFFLTALFKMKFLTWHGPLGSVTTPRRQLGHVVYVRMDTVLTKRRVWGERPGREREKEHSGGAVNNTVLCYLTPSNWSQLCL